MLQLARAFLDKNGPKFFWAALGSYWYDYVEKMLANGHAPPTQVA